MAYRGGFFPFSNNRRKVNPNYAMWQGTRIRTPEAFYTGGIITNERRENIKKERAYQKELYLSQQYKENTGQDYIVTRIYGIANRRSRAETYYLCQRNDNILKWHTSRFVEENFPTVLKEFEQQTVFYEYRDICKIEYRFDITLDPEEKEIPDITTTVVTLERRNDDTAHEEDEVVISRINKNSLIESRDKVLQVTRPKKEKPKEEPPESVGFKKPSGKTFSPYSFDLINEMSNIVDNTQDEDDEAPATRKPRLYEDEDEKAIWYSGDDDSEDEAAIFGETEDTIPKISKELSQPVKQQPAKLCRHIGWWLVALADTQFLSMSNRDQDINQERYG